jgi:parallel beta-helix repeat protein
LESKKLALPWTYAPGPKVYKPYHANLKYPDSNRYLGRKAKGGRKMSLKLEKLLGILVCVVMIVAPLLTELSTRPKSTTMESDDRISEAEEPPSDVVSLAHGTRGYDIEGNIFEQASPTYNIPFGMGNWAVGVKFDVNQDCTIDQLGIYNNSYCHVYNLRFWDASTQNLLSQVANPYVPPNSWGWFNIPLIFCPAGEYIVSADVHEDNISCIENPGPTSFGIIEPTGFQYSYIYSYPSLSYPYDLLPLVDVHYQTHIIADIMVPDNYTSIQEAIIAANVGDTILVRENSIPYNEELTIDKRINLIGEKRKTTIINASGIQGGSGIVIDITADHVRIWGFTITGGDYGIYCDRTNGTYIRWNLIKQNNDYGIYLNITTNDWIEDDTISQNNFDGDYKGFGIYAVDSNAKHISYNIISYNEVGVKLDNSTVGSFIDNTFIGNGIAVDYDPTPLIIDNNMFINNTIAIKITGDNSPITISNNIISGSEIGILVEIGSPVIDGNTIKNNTYGIYCLSGTSPIINNNIFLDNDFNIFSIISAQVDVDPDTLNLKSKGKWITCYIELLQSMDVKDIDVSTVRISDINGNSVDIPAEKRPTGIGDNDGDSVPDLMVKFDRSEVEDQSNPGDATITISGELKDSTVFEGYDTINVKNPP